MRKGKCGIYRILCVGNGKYYVGSSTSIDSRCSQHRSSLRRGRHTSPYLQHAWTAYGEASFQFSVIEECDRSLLSEREQYFVEQLRPEFNSMRVIFPRKEPSLEMRAKMTAALRALAALITHCPKGHAYDEANTALNQGKRICRACNALRVRAVYASETPEQREHRRQLAKVNHEKNREMRLAKLREYGLNHKKEIREYNREKWAREKQSRTAEEIARIHESRSAAAKLRMQRRVHHQKGKPQSPESRAKISATLKKTVAENGTHWSGRHHSEETKETIRALKIAYYQNR